MNSATPLDAVLRARSTSEIRRAPADLWCVAAAVIWTVIVLICCCKPLFTKGNSVYPIFAEAGRRWLAGEELYRITTSPYRYSPTATLVFAVFGELPDRLGGALWRLLNAAVYLSALAYFLRVGLPIRLSRRQRAWVFLLAAPLSIGSLHNGQSNALMMGLMLWGAAAFAERRWTLAAIGLTLATLLKVYPLALALLFITLAPRRFGLRFTILLVLGLAVPFLFQQTNYVASQYESWLEHLRTQDRNDWPIAEAYRDLRILVRAAGGTVSGGIYLAFQLATGVALCSFVQVARRVGWSRQHLLTLTLTLACCWMTLCGSATESSTYLLFGPVLGWSILAVWHGHNLLARSLVLASYGLFTFAQMLVWFPTPKTWYVVSLQPLAGLVLVLGLLAIIVHELTKGPAHAVSE